jgi:hypothetical protein
VEGDVAANEQAESRMTKKNRAMILENLCIKTLKIEGWITQAAPHLGRSDQPPDRLPAFRAETPALPCFRRRREAIFCSGHHPGRVELRCRSPHCGVAGIHCDPPGQDGGFDPVFSSSSIRGIF